MTFRYLLICFSISLCISGFAQKSIERDRQKRILNHIRKETQYVTAYENGQPQARVIASEAIYDSLGNETEFTRYKDGKPNFKWIYKYNSSGQLISMKGYDKKNSISSSIEYEYDNAGNQTGYKQLNSDEDILMYQKREYNSKHQNTKLFNPVNQNFRKFYLAVEYFYNDNGEYSYIKNYDEDKNVTATEIYEYDAAGNGIATKQYDGKDTSILASSKYNDRGLVIETFFPGEILGIKKDLFVTSPESRKTLYSYDTQGNLVEKKSHKGEILVEKIEYVYTIK